MKHLYTKRFRYKGYAINVYTSETAVVVCKQLKGKYIPFFNENQCKECIDYLRGEEGYSTMTRKQLREMVRREMKGC